MLKTSSSTESHQHELPWQGLKRHTQPSCSQNKTWDSTGGEPEASHFLQFLCKIFCGHFVISLVPSPFWTLFPVSQFLQHPKQNRSTFWIRENLSYTLVLSLVTWARKIPKHQEGFHGLVLREQEGEAFLEGKAQISMAWHSMDILPPAPAAPSNFAGLDPLTGHSMQNTCNPWSYLETLSYSSLRLNSPSVSLTSSFTALGSLLSERRKILHHLDMPQTRNEDQLTWTKAEAHYICACPNYLAKNKYTGKEQIDEDKTRTYFLTNRILNKYLDSFC